MDKEFLQVGADNGVGDVLIRPCVIVCLIAMTHGLCRVSYRIGDTVYSGVTGEDRLRAAGLPVPPQRE